MTSSTDLSAFTVGDYHPGAGRVKILLWSFFNYFLFNSSVPWPRGLKVFLLRAFGAQVGPGLVIKIRVRIKYPWRLRIGGHCWIGESVWIDNLEDVVIGNHVCLSQGALLLTGNHDYTVSHFPYRLGRIVLEDGVWIGARAVVCPWVVCGSHAILTVNSVAARSLEGWKVYVGNPARATRERVITDRPDTLS
jgi:putative colanic acid biosynthesis acetyltransferase WcaF